MFFISYPPADGGVTPKKEVGMDKIAVLIPCYNEAQTVGKVVADWRTALP